MTDIVKRLRAEGENAMRQHLSLGMHRLCALAADEIERLRGVVAELRTKGVQCACGKIDRPVYLNGAGEHICGDCWLVQHKDDPPDNPMPWELGS